MEKESKDEAHITDSKEMMKMMQVMMSLPNKSSSFQKTVN